MDKTEYIKEYRLKNKERIKERTSQYHKQWYEQNKERIKAKTSNYYLTHKQEIKKYRTTKNYKDLKKKWDKKHYEKYKPIILEQCKVYRKIHSEKYSWVVRKKYLSEWRRTPKHRNYEKQYRSLPKSIEYQKRYKSLNRVLYVLCEQKRRIKLKEIVHDFSLDDWLKKVQATKGICPGCKKDIGISKLTLDHIMPISKAEKGHIYTINDVQPLCGSCNPSKSNKLNWRGLK